jgi:hypothetical protein
MDAEDLHVVPLVTWSSGKPGATKGAASEAGVKLFDTNRYYDLRAGEDAREGGGLLFFRLDKPLDLAGAGREYPSPLTLIEAAHATPGAWVDAEKPFWWDLPVWLACGQLDSIGLCNDRMCRNGMQDDEAWGKPRNPKRLPPPMGSALWSQEIYHHVLNCGFRIPPSAGSGTGESPNPMGYNRMYVWVDKQQFDYDAWWEGFRAGRVFVTNGPLIRPQADGRIPGHVFKTSEEEKLTLDVVLNVHYREPIDYFEIIKNGRVVQSLRLEEISRTGHFHPLEFDESGWFVVRAVSDVEHTYRFASSAPWYVEIGGKPQRINKRSARFFLDWANERAGRVKLDDEEKRREVMEIHEKSIKFWQDLLERAEEYD